MPTGFLDALMDDPSTQLALGLLGGQGNFGQRAIQGMSLIDAQSDRKQKQAMQALQAARLKQQMDGADFDQNILRAAFPGMGGATGAAPAQPPATAPRGLLNPESEEAYASGNIQRPNIAPAAPQQTTQQPGAYPFSINQLAALAASGHKGADALFNQYKYVNDGSERKPGSFYKNTSTGQMEWVPSVEKGMMPADANNAGAGVIAQPGYSAVNAEAKGAEAAATTRATNVNTPLPLAFTDATGKPLGGSIGAYLGAPQNSAGPGGQDTTRPYGTFSNPDTSLPAILALKDPMERAQAMQAWRSQFAPGTMGAAAPASVGQSDADRAAAEASKKLVVGQSENIVGAGNKVNDAWLKNSYEPAITNGNAAQGLIETTTAAREAMRSMGGTGWGTETKAAAANILTGLGIAPVNAQLFASSAQLFQKNAMERLWSTLNAAKGQQTEGDAQRAAKTYANLGNTTQANEFILDMAQAQAERDKKKSEFYNAALPAAQQSGDLSGIDRTWQRRAPSIFDMPSMQRWKQ